MSEETVPERHAAEVFVSCRSNSPQSHAAAELADELALRRDGIVLPLASAVEAGRRAVVVVDGCSSACGARLLETHGVTPAAALTLDDSLAESVDVAADLVERGALARRMRRPAPPTAAPTGSVHTVEDYLIAIDWLTSPVGPCGALVEDAPTLAAHVSTTLAVSRPTAGEMLGRLEQQQLIRRGASKEIVLTPAGRATTDRVVRVHRILERFAVDTLGYGLDDCFEHARRLAPSFDDDAVARLDHALGHPDRCPHGWPVDAATAREAAGHLVALGALGPGVLATVALLPENDAALLRDLVAAGLVPGAPVVRAERSPGGAVRVEVSGVERAIGEATAGIVLVCPP